MITADAGVQVSYARQLQAQAPAAHCKRAAQDAVAVGAAPGIAQSR